MQTLSSRIFKSLSQSEFLSFSEFEQVILDEDKSDSLMVTLEVGLRVATIGQAFSLGYRCALQNLWPRFKQNQWAAFCVTEESGAHPKKLKTTISTDQILTGSKSFVSMADRVSELLVIAVAGNDEDRPILKAVKLSLPSTGVDLKIMPGMGMIPELVHGKLTFDNAKGCILEGDGYLDFNKRFRSIEDAHLLMAFTALILSKVVRSKREDTLIDDCMVIITSLLAVEFNDESFGVFQLAGLHKNLELLVMKFEEDLAYMDSAFQSEWKRDSKVFSLSKKTRVLQRKSALDSFRLRTQ